MSFKVKVGNLTIGGGSAVTIQSMCNTSTKDVAATVGQIQAATRAGVDIMRVTVRDETEAKAIKEIKKQITVPLVADIHVDYRLAIAAIENGADKIRINPGNIGSDENIEKVATALKRNGVPCRVGSNSGSVEKKFAEKYGNNEIAIAESALEKAALLERFGVKNIVLSAKSSSVKTTVAAYRYLKNKCDYRHRLAFARRHRRYAQIFACRSSRRRGACGRKTAQNSGLRQGGRGGGRLPHLRKNRVRQHRACRACGKNGGGR